jgi:DNA-binding NtrC family response regulator
MSDVFEDGGAPASLKDRVARFEQRLILQALERCDGNQRRAARELGLLPTTLNEKLKRLGLRPKEQEPAA